MNGFGLFAILFFPVRALYWRWRGIDRTERPATMVLSFLSLCVALAGLSLAYSNGAELVPNAIGWGLKVAIIPWIAFGFVIGKMG